MPITTAQLERRKLHLGASDMASLFGLNPYRTAYDLWADKTGKLQDDDEPSQAMELGNAMEPVLLNHAAKALGPIRRNQFRKHPKLPIGSNLDAILLATGEPVEAKTSGLLGPARQAWGEDGSDQVPQHVIIQVHTQMLCLAPAAPIVAHVPALVGFRGLLMFHVVREERIIDAIAEMAEKFWVRNVLADIPPHGTPTLSVAKLLRRTPGKIVELDPGLLVKWSNAKDALGEAKKVKDTAHAALLGAMGDAEAADFGSFGTVTNYEQHRKASQVKASTFRVMRFKKPQTEGAAS